MADEAHERRPRSRATAATRAYSSSCSSRRASARGCSRISPRKSSPGDVQRRRLRRRHAPRLRRAPSRPRGCRRARRRPRDRRRRAADVGPAEDAARARPSPRRARSSSGDPERVEVAHRVDHRQDAAGEDPVRPAHGAVADADLDARRGCTSSSLPLAPRRPRRSRARRGRPPRSRPSDVVSGARWMPSTMICTITSLRASAAPTMPGSRCMNGRIALKRCVTVRDAAVEGGVRLLRRRVGVAARDGDAAREERVDQLERAGQLGRERHDSHRPGREQPLEQAGVGVAAADGRMRARGAGPRGTGPRGGRRARARRRRRRSPGSLRARRRASSSGAVISVGRYAGDAGLEQRLARTPVAVARPLRGSRRRRSRSPAGRRSPARRCRVRSPLRP